MYSAEAGTNGSQQDETSNAYTDKAPQAGTPGDEGCPVMQDPLLYNGRRTFIEPPIDDNLASLGDFHEKCGTGDRAEEDQLYIEGFATRDNETCSTHVSTW